MTKNRNILIPLLIMIIGGHGCSLFSSKTRAAAKVVFAPREVGTPEGDKVTKEIGRAAGLQARTAG